MIPVSIEGVRRNFGISSVFMYTVTLIDETGQRIFNILVERHEALPIVAALHNLPLPRPQTINVTANTLKFHSTLAEMCLERISMSPVYLLSTVLRWRKDDKSETEQKLDMSPGDALGLALLTGYPLLFSDELAKQLGVPLSEGQTPELYLINDLLRREGITLPEGKNLRMGFSKTPMRDALLKEFKASLLGKAPPFPEDDLEQRKKDFLTFLLGSAHPPLSS
jgi:bifunctional DNase/RNase